MKAFKEEIRIMKYWKVHFHCLIIKRTKLRKTIISQSIRRIGALIKLITFEQNAKICGHIINILIIAT